MLNYETIAGKLRLIGLGNFHEILNRVIDANSPAALGQQARDLRALVVKIDGSVTKAISTQRSLREEKAKKTTRKVELNQIIDQVLTDDDPTNDNLAVVKQRELDAIETRLAEIDVELPKAITLEATHTELKSMFEADIQDLEHQIQQLKSAEVSTKAAEEAAEGLKVVQQIREARAGMRNSDSVIARAKSRQTDAEVALERAITSVRSGSGASEAEILARAKIEERKKALAQKGAGQTGTSVPAAGSSAQA